MKFVPSESEAHSINSESDTVSTVDSLSDLPLERRRKLREWKRSDLEREYRLKGMFLPTLDILRAHNDPKFRVRYLSTFWLLDPETKQYGTPRYKNCTEIPPNALLDKSFGVDHKLSYAMQMFLCN